MNSAGNDRLAEAMRDAVQAGEAAEPSKLIALIGGLEHPLQALQDMQQCNELFVAFDEDFGFVRGPSRQPDRALYAALLRWLIEGLRQWKRADDPYFKCLTALIVVAQVCDLGNALWSQLPNDLGTNPDLTGYLRTLIASFDATFTAREGNAPPISESDLVEKFQVADVAGDWPAVFGMLRQFPVFFANALQTATVRYLYRYDLSGLVAGLHDVHKTAVAMQHTGVLAPEQRLHLGIASANSYVRIAAAYRTLVDNRGVTLRALPDEQESLLVELLFQVADDAVQWPQWMKALVRHPALQKPLGQVLSRGPESALDGYVDSLWLLPKQAIADASRQNVTECLRVFCAVASTERRAALWKRGFERWRAWAFNEADSNQHLMAVNWSDLDYAVVAYALECMNDVKRNEAMLAISTEMETLEHRWHASYTDILTAWYRLLSQLQPYAHASELAKNGGDWLPQRGAYMPNALLQGKYLALMYNVAV